MNGPVHQIGGRLGRVLGLEVVLVLGLLKGHGERTTRPGVELLDHVVNVVDFVAGQGLGVLEGERVVVERLVHVLGVVVGVAGGLEVDFGQDLVFDVERLRNGFV